MIRRKKRYLALGLFVLFIQLFVLFGGAPSVLAIADQTDAERALNENVNELLQHLDLKALEDYVHTLQGFSNVSVRDRLLEFITGEQFDYEKFGERLLSVLFGDIRELLPAFACITAVALLSGLLSTLGSGSLANTASNMIFLVSYASALIPLLAVVTECIRQSIACVVGMKTQMTILFPLLLTLMATSGGTVSVAICRPAVAFFSTTIVSLISSVVFPISIAIIVFSLASNLSRDLKINKFGAFFKSINKWIIGISVSVFGLFFTLQGITASTYDGVVKRTIKYAIGTGVPIVGGFLSGGFDLAIAGSILIKNALGGMSIFLLVSILFEPIILLVSVNILLRLTSAITQPFGDSRISDFLGETADNLNYFTAGILFTAFLYFLCVVMTVTVSEALL